jgi:catechol 2,3-dioxygenase-like lactoylglutathione lyase family enzyme
MSAASITLGDGLMSADATLTGAPSGSEAPHGARDAAGSAGRASPTQFSAKRIAFARRVCGSPVANSGGASLTGPPDPLQVFRQRAKRFLKRVRDGDPRALETARLHPLFRGGVDPARFALSDAQLVIARAEGFDSWPRLAAARSKDQTMTDVIFNGLGLRLWATPDDFAATADFYGEALGLKCTWRSDAQGVATYELGFGPTVVVERAEPTAEHAPILRRFTGFSFEVPDIDAAYAALQAHGVPFQGPPERQYWGGVMACFTDPAGNSHTLLQRPGKG